MRISRMEGKIVKGILILNVLLAAFCFGSEPASRAEFEKEQQKNQAEFRGISITLAEIKNELVHMNQDLGELKELRRTVLDRMIDILLAGGLAYSGSIAWRNRRNGRKQEG